MDQRECPNKDKRRFRVEILAMDPEADTTRSRAIQLGRDPRDYRDEQRDSLDNMYVTLDHLPNLEIVTYKSLPTRSRTPLTTT